MGEPSIDTLHDPYEEQLSAARYKAERDAAVQELQGLRKGADYLEDMYHEAFADLLSETAKAKRLGRLVWRLQNRLARSHRREKALRKGMREWREKAIGGPVRTVSAYDLLPEADLETLRWVREHGGLERVKWLLDWCLSHDSKIERLDFDYWLSGRVMHELGFEGDMADLDEVERRLLARLMPEGMQWPCFEDGEPVKFGDVVSDGDETGRVYYVIFDTVNPVIIGFTDEEPDRDPGTWLEVSVSDGERVKRPPVPAGDEKPLEVEQTVLLVGDDGSVKLECEVIDPNGGAGEFSVMVREVGKYGYSYVRPSSLIHAKPEPPDSWERIEEDLGDEIAKQQCGPISPELACKLAGEFVRRCQALAERGE